MKKPSFINKLLYVLLIVFLLPTAFPVSSNQAFAAETSSTQQPAPKQSPSTDNTHRTQIKNQYNISDDELQSVLDQGYTLEDAENALSIQRKTGEDLTNALGEVSPRAVNLSQEAKSTVVNNLEDKSFAPSSIMSLNAIPDYSYVKTKPDEAPFTVQLDQEDISTLSGGLSLHADDMSLPGRNGLGFTLSRVYDSGSSQFDQMTIVGSSNGTQQPLDEKRFPIGKGWSWDISYLEDTGTDKYLHLSGSGVFKVNMTAEANSRLVGYPWRDLSFTEDTTVTAGGSTSAYALKSIQKISQYFNAEGQLILISDAYGNKITFTYTNNADYGSVLSSITDAIGNTISITYSISSVVLTKGTQTVTYYKSTQNGKELLSQVVDPIGRATTYNYSLEDAKFNLLGTTPDTLNPYALLTGVIYPTGASTVYTYEASPVTRYIDENAVNQVYRIKSRENKFTKADSTVETDNHKDITYPSGDIGSSYNTDITFSAAVDDGLSKTTFSNKKDYIDADNPPVFYNTQILSTATSGGKTYTKKTDYTYDTARKWPVPITTTVTDSVSGSSTTHVVSSSTGYDDYGNITSTINPLNATTTNTYDSSTHLLKTTATPINGAGQWQYTTYTRNGQGTVTKVQVLGGTSTGPSGSALQETSYENIDTATGNVGTVRTKNGTTSDTVTTIQYASTYQGGFPTSTSTTVHDADGAATTLTGSYAYDKASGNLTQYTDGMQVITTYSYDALGRVTKVLHNSDGTSATIAYHDFQNQMITTDETGLSTVTNWNPLGWKTDEGILADDTYQAKAKYGYDTNGRMLWSEDALGNRATYGYDQWSRQNAVTYPGSTGQSTSVYDDIASTLTTTDPVGYKIMETYDKLGRTTLQQETKVGKDPSKLASYTYDDAGNMLTMTDGETPANTATYAYNALSQLSSVSNTVNGAVQKTSYSYDMLGDLTQILYPDNKTTVKKYDEAGRLIQNTEAAVSGKNNVEKFYYDGNGNQTRLIDRNGNRFKYTYDSRNFLKKKEIVDSGWNPITGEETISFEYDHAGRRLKMTDGTGITSYSYDPYTGAISTVTFPDAKVMTYDYDANGNRTQMNDPFGFNTFYHYDMRNRLDVVGPSNDFTNDYDAKYQYFNDDLLKQITQRNGVTSVYSYSGKQVESLTEKKANGSALNAFSYTYDPNGNEKTRTENGTVDTFTYDELNRLETSTQFNETYAYDNRGNRKSLKTNHPFDRPDGTTAYDKRDRLTSVTKTSGGSVTYRYNGDGLLWERAENGKTTRYYWDGDQIIAEASVTGDVATLEARYIRGQGLIAREDNQGKAYYVANGHGDIVNVMDNSGLTKLNAYSYDGFGNIEAESETVPQPFKYSGEMQDGSTGLQYLRARWYDPSIGRFIDEDTVDGQITNPLSLNLYTYVENNPLTNVDPTGHWCTSADGKYSHPGGCNDGVSGSLRFEGAGYSDDMTHDGQEILKGPSFIGPPATFHYPVEDRFIRWSAGDNDAYFSANRSTQNEMRTLLFKQTTAKEGLSDFIDGLFWGATLASGAEALGAFRLGSTALVIMNENKLSVCKTVDYDGNTDQ